MSVNRRDFLRSAAGLASAAALAGKSSLVSAQTQSLPSPAASGIEHIVVVMMENRSFVTFCFTRLSPVSLRLISCI